MTPFEPALFRAKDKQIVSESCFRSEADSSKCGGTMAIVSLRSIPGARFLRVNLAPVVTCLLLAGSVGAGAMERRCAKVASLAGDAKSLPNLHAKVAEGENIKVVAFGSSSTEGTGYLPKSEIFASVLGRELSKELLTPVEIVNKGKGGDTIPKMVARMERDVIALKPDLVVWQLGVNDVLQMDGVEGAISQMQSAIDTLRAHGLPVVLVDLQVAPMVDRDRDTPVMQAAIEKEGTRPGVLHFHRQALMRRMIETGDSTMDDLVLKDGLHMSQLGHLCTGQLLARQIAHSSLEVRVSAR